MLVFGSDRLHRRLQQSGEKAEISGLTGKRKFFLQILASCAVAVALLSLTASGTYSTQLSVPFFKNFHPDLVIHSLLSHALPLVAGLLPFLLFVALVIVGSSNAVNLTDGLDGLAIGCVVVAAGALTVLTYVTSFARFRDVSGHSASSAGGRADDFLRRACRIRLSDFSGTTRIPRKYSWAMSARSRSAARSG